MGFKIVTDSCANLTDAQIKEYGVEIISQAIDNAKENAKANNITNSEFFVGKSEEIIPRLIQDGRKWRFR